MVIQFIVEVEVDDLSQSELFDQILSDMEEIVAKRSLSLYDSKWEEST